MQNIRTAHDRIDPGHGIRWPFPRDRAVKGRAHGIDVGPRALLFFSGFRRVVLLEGRVARCHQCRQCARRDADGLPRGAEIEQHRRAIFAQIDIVRLDVAVDESSLMYHLQSVQQRHDHGAQLGLAAYLLGFEEFFQAFAALVLHHHVGSAVGFEHTHDTHDVGVAEFRQRAGLGDESIQTPTVGVAVILGDGVYVAVVAAGREFHW